MVETKPTAHRELANNRIEELIKEARGLRKDALSNVRSCETRLNVIQIHTNVIRELLKEDNVKPAKVAKRTFHYSQNGRDAVCFTHRQKAYRHNTNARRITNNQDGVTCKKCLKLIKG